MTAQTSQPDVITLTAENASVKAKLAQRSNDEKLIAEKVGMGLTQEQAVSALAHQRAYAERKTALNR